jgi:hypothetical protein
MKKITLSKLQRKVRAQARRRYSITMYVPVADNVYYDGYSYRVRVTNDYERTSKNFNKIKKAIKFRDKLKNI